MRTSAPYPPSLPDLHAFAISSSTTRPPRAVLMMMALSFIVSIRFLLMKPRLSSVRFMCSEMMSASVMIASAESAR